MTSTEPMRGVASRSGDLKEALLQVATALDPGVDRQYVLRRIAEQLSRQVPHTELMIGLVDRDDRVVTPVFAQGPDAGEKLAMRIPFGEGLTGRVAATGRPVIYNQAATDDPGLAPFPVPGSGSGGVEYVLAVPLVGPDGPDGPEPVDGVLVLYRQGAGQLRWCEEDRRTVELFAANARVAIRNAELYQASEQRAKRLTAMNEVLRCTSTGLDADVQTICTHWEKALRELIPFTISGIALERPAGDDGQCMAVWLSGDTIDFRVGEPLPPESAPMWAIKERKGYVLDDLRVYSPHGPHAGLEDGSVAAVVVAPLMARGEAFGVIGVGHAEPGRYNHETLKLLKEVAVYLSAAIDNVLLHKQVVDSSESQSRLLARLIHFQEEERRKLAAELHDDTIQLLAAALLRADGISDLESGRHPELLAKLRSTLEEAMARARAIMVNLRPPVLDAGGLRMALEQQLETLTAEGVKATLEWQIDAELDARLDATAETLMFRTLQEAIQNVRKHAHASHVTVRLQPGSPPGRVTAQVIDDGRGFDVSGGLRQAIHGAHLGLHSMIEQVATAGGKVEIDSSGGTGTRVMVSMPIKIGVPQ